MTQHTLRPRTLAIAAPLMALALAGCNSRPESKDVEAALGAVYGCPAFSLQGVKKTNGEPGPQGSYDVAFEYTVAVKGGEAGGVKFMTNWLYLVSEASATRQALAALDRQAPGAPAVEARIQAYDTQVTAELQQLIPCAGPEIDAVVEPLFVSAKEAAASATTAGLPIGIRLGRTGRMVRSEQGWYFKALAPGFSSLDMVTSSARPLALSPSKVPQMLGAASAEGVGSAERTLTGVLRRGLTDSCLAVTTDGAEKCYSLPGDPAQAQRILSTCTDGDACRVTGRFDDKAESVVGVSKAETVGH